MAMPNQFTAPTQEYGGDEVSALVLDPGYSTTRAGFAGEDTPKSVVPTYYGFLSNNGDHKLLFGENDLHTPLSNLDIRNPLAESGSEDWVNDWDTAAKLWEYSITSRLTGPRPSDPKTNGLNDTNGDADVEMEGVDEYEKPMADSPLLMTEPGKTSIKSREKAIENAMENWGVPAFWLGRSGVLAAFSAGKATALVIDIGASGIQVSPVNEGLILKKGVRSSPLGGNWMSKQIRILFATQQTVVPLVPHYMVKSKISVEAGQPSQATYRQFEKPPSNSFRQWEEERVLTEFKESVVQVWEQPGRLKAGGNEERARNCPNRPFEMPDGWNQVFGAEKFFPAEGLFDADAALVDSETTKPKPEHTIPMLIKAAVNSVDSELRPTLLNNIVVCGAGSLYQGLVRRIDLEVNTLYPGPRVRVQASGQVVERKYASWIGGSILGSLGTFHQMWISKKEYDEHGPNIIEKRCK
ncbi:actin-like protein-like protein 6A [Venturia nashicola]|uniref:Actin-like protein-like protein 6A n=1 Tax=Venturia nashicola TaxID=86259 RepID=A0A4Z1NI33_9PEZI|nr:actin-like protein-like protein 6A [Venturia nashicola]TLD20025.1 actin-like protein-like protein 6A [Venturia nashicola]